MNEGEEVYGEYPAGPGMTQPQVTVPHELFLMRILEWYRQRVEAFYSAYQDADELQRRWLFRQALVPAEEFILRARAYARVDGYDLETALGGVEATEGDTPEDQLQRIRLQVSTAEEFLYASGHLGKRIKRPVVESDLVNSP